MFSHAKEVGVERIAVPRVGCGIGGLDYKDVRKVFVKWAEYNEDIDLVVVTQ